MSKKNRGENVLSPTEVQALRNQLENATQNARLLDAKLTALDIADLLTRCAEVKHDRSTSG